jgi:neurofibromin 1
VQWKNLTLFLAAFGGVCVVENYNLSALTSIIPAQHLPDEMRDLQDPVTMVSAFITDLTDLLIAESAQVREVARDALGIELSPRLYGKLFRHLEEFVIPSTVVSCYSSFQSV